MQRVRNNAPTALTNSEWREIITLPEFREAWGITDETADGRTPAAGVHCARHQGESQGGSPARRVGADTDRRPSHEAGAW